MIYNTEWGSELVSQKLNISERLLSWKFFSPFLLLFTYSCLHFPLLLPTTPGIPSSQPRSYPSLALSLCPLYIVSVSLLVRNYERGEMKITDSKKCLLTTTPPTNPPTHTLGGFLKFEMFFLIIFIDLRERGKWKRERGREGEGGRERKKLHRFVVPLIYVFTG